MKILRRLNDLFSIRNKIFKDDIESIFNVSNLVSIFTMRLILILIEFLETNTFFKLIYRSDIIYRPFRNYLIYITNIYILI